MSNETYISFYLSTFRIHIFSKAIIEIGNPKFIRFLVKEDGQSMIAEAYHKRTSSHTACRKEQTDAEMEVRSPIGCFSKQAALEEGNRTDPRQDPS